MSQSVTPAPTLRLLDPRITPARGDIAAAHLQGLVAADRYVEGARLQVRAANAGLRRRPDAASEQVDQALFGEIFVAYDRPAPDESGWAWGQLEQTGYVGWMALGALGAVEFAPDHRVQALRTVAFSEPNLKSRPLMFLSINAKLALGERSGRFVRAERAGWIHLDHLAPIDASLPDFVATAERLVGAPYVWGGRDSMGLDCSGLVHLSLEASGVRAPRDSDMQEAALGEALPQGLAGELRRGDLVFWPGHVGVLLAPDLLLHANAWHMAAEIEPLAEAVARIRPHAGDPRVIKRLKQ